MDFKQESASNCTYQNTCKYLHVFFCTFWGISFLEPLKILQKCKSICWHDTCVYLLVKMHSGGRFEKRPRFSD
jgi:hypothetical protein